MKIRKSTLFRLLDWFCCGLIFGAGVFAFWTGMLLMGGLMP